MLLALCLWFVFPTEQQEDPTPTPVVVSVEETAQWMTQRLRQLWSDLGLPSEGFESMAVQYYATDNEFWEMRVLEVEIPAKVRMMEVVKGLLDLVEEQEYPVELLWSRGEEGQKIADLWVNGHLTHRLLIRALPEEPQRVTPRMPPPPQIALIMDDLGNTYDHIRSLFDKGIPLTLSVFPQRPFSHRIASEAQTRDLEVMLHLPMEPWGYPEKDPGRGALMVDMGDSELERVLLEDLQDIPQASGVNNHMGSRFTEHREAMQQVMEVLAARGLYFVDSLTSPRSVGYELAKQMGVRAHRRHVFLDVVQDEQYIRTQFRELLRLAELQGYAIGICHPYPETIKLLPDLYELAMKDGYQWVRVSQLGIPGGESQGAP